MSQEKPLIYTSRFKVKGHDVNADKYITIPNLLKNMQECSLQHARQLKTSVWDMEEDEISWVLLRKEMNVIEPLRLDDEFTIITYPSGFDKFFAYRDYLVFNEQKKLITAASSTWTLINTETRKLSKIPEKILKIGTPENLKFLTQAKKSIQLVDDLAKVDARKVRPYDLDWNNHINNIVLVRYMVEVIMEKGVKDQEISKLLVHFKNEVKLDEVLDVWLSEKEKTYSSVLKMSDDKVVASCTINLANNA